MCVLLEGYDAAHMTNFILSFPINFYVVVVVFLSVACKFSSLLLFRGRTIAGSCVSLPCHVEAVGLSCMYMENGRLVESQT